MPRLSTGTISFLNKNSKVFYFISIVGFIFSFLVHFSTFIGFKPTLNYFWFLHVGIFVVFFPALVLNDYYRKRNSRLSSVEFGMGNSPDWLKLACLIFGVYALVNFGLFMIAMGGGGPDFVDGSYVVSSHGQIIREITEQEYWHLQAIQTRGFSGHWMVFYLFAASILHKQIKKSELKPDQF